LTQATDKESVSEYREGVFGLGKVRRPAEVGEKQMNVRGGVRSIESLITISMDYACITITKRDGSKENFSIEKIERAIAKAYRADGMNDDETSIKQVTAEVAAAIDKGGYLGRRDSGFGRAQIDDAQSLGSEEIYHLSGVAYQRT